MVEAAKTPGVLAENDVLIAGHTVSADQGLVEAASQNVAAAKEALRSVSQTESYLMITAPFDGVVTTRNLHPCALIGPASGPGGAQPILQIVDDKRLRLAVPIPEAQLGDMKTGQLVSFTVPAYPGQTFKAPIERISREVDEKSRPCLWNWMLRILTAGCHLAASQMSRGHSNEAIQHFLFPRQR
jgi:multidrug resistance efflux pump